MPWNLVCDPWVSWSFFSKTTISSQLTKFSFCYLPDDCCFVKTP